MKAFNKHALLLAVAWGAMLVSGCAATPEEFEKAARACDSHGGLKYYYVFPWTQVHCKNGTVIKTLGE